MYLHLDNSAIAELSAIPETGMGFQHVQAKFEGQVTQFLVINGTDAFQLNALGLAEGFDPSTIAANGEKVLRAALDDQFGFFSSNHPRGFSLLSSRIPVTSSPSAAPHFAPPSSLVKRHTLAAPRQFFRYSAFNPDRRVNPHTGDWLPGTYGTTESETHFVPTGFVAVGRFALPLSLPASFRYEITAPLGTTVAFGTVAPAFGQSGGGVEAFFVGPVVHSAPPAAGLMKIPDE